MKRAIPVLVVGILVLSGLGAGAFSNEKPENFKIEESVSFSEMPVLQENYEDGYLRVGFEGVNSMLMESGKPELPIYIKNYQLPRGAKNIQVVCTPKETSTMYISGEIVPTKVVIRDYTVDDVPLTKDEVTYSNSEFYPDSWFSYRVSSGLNGDDEIVKFVDIACYVVRYSPANNILEYVNGDIDISFTYDYSDTGTTSYDPEYDMVIIAPAAFEESLQTLIDHKNSYGVDTTLKTVEDILSEYDGYDAPEQIKYFIKYALDEWGITYAMLVGGLKG